MSIGPTMRGRVAGSTPRPVSGIWFGLPSMLLAMVMRLERSPTVVGANCTVIVQDAAGGSAPHDWPTMAKSPGLIPPRLTAPMDRSASPAFWRTTALGADAVPLFCDPKSTAPVLPLMTSTGEAIG